MKYFSRKMMVKAKRKEAKSRNSKALLNNN
jgi:hypothetical protein